MQFALKDFAYLDDLDFFKIIISSADTFPGLYRFTSSWQAPKIDDQFLKLTSFAECCHRTELGQRWERREWLHAHEQVHGLSFGEHGRNSERQEKDVGLFLEQRALAWAGQELPISLAYIDTDFLVDEILPEATYYVMGSLIRFATDRTYVAYDEFRREWLYELAVPFDEAHRYIAQVFSPESLRKLFFRSEILGELAFHGALGDLRFRGDLLQTALAVASPGSLIFGAFRYPHKLPIQFAKLIGISNVCR